MKIHINNEITSNKQPSVKYRYVLCFKLFPFQAFKLIGQSPG
ncbi:hypothetical protein FBY21_1461 [Pseudomonas sp. SLBN-26]|nr:hypothetical protein [Pseudomonas otitidis]TQL06109.1 hypothetical protein FBY21_1461 [Pseudomonas sp. SLBN-26]